jgi:hypothetical protein
MVRPLSTAGASGSPRTQLAQFIARFDPAIAALARSARAAIRQRLPTATELVYDNYNAAAVQQARPRMPATGRGHTVIKSISARRRSRRRAPRPRRAASR